MNGLVLAGTIAAGVYAIPAVIVFCFLLSFEHMGDPGAAAAFRKKPREWLLSAQVAVLWLPLLGAMLYGRFREGC